MQLLHAPAQSTAIQLTEDLTLEETSPPIETVEDAYASPDGVGGRVVRGQVLRTVAFHAVPYWIRASVE